MTCEEIERMCIVAERVGMFACEQSEWERVRMPCERKNIYKWRTACVVRGKQLYNRSPSRLIWI